MTFVWRSEGGAPSAFFPGTKSEWYWPGSGTVLPDGTLAVLDATAWTPPPVFAWLARVGEVAPEEMLRVFNCGVGMAVVVTPDNVAAATALLTEHGETVCRIGHIEAGSGPAAVRIDGLKPGWPG